MAASAAGTDEANLLSGRGILADSGGVADVLMVTTTMGMLNRVASHTTDNGPVVALDSVLVRGTASLQHRLVQAATTSNNANNSTALGGNHLLGAGGQTQLGLAGLLVVADDGAVLAGSASKSPAVTGLLLNVAHNGTLGQLRQRQHVADGESSLLAEVQVLSGGHTLRGHKMELVLLVVDGVASRQSDQRSATPRVVLDLSDHTLHVTIALAVACRGELGRGNLQALAGDKHAALTATLCEDDLAHS